MKQTRSTFMLMALAVIVAVGLPYYLSSQKASALDTKTKGLKTEEAAFKAKSVTGERVRKAKAEWSAQQALLASAMPANPDIQGAIRTLQGLTDGDAAPDRVRWVSASVTNLKSGAAEPTVATTVKPGAAATKTTVAEPAKPTSAGDSPNIPTGGFDITISVEGSRAKVLAFVSKIQQKPEVLPRLFAVKSVTLTVDKAAPSTNGAVVAEQTATANVKLKVTTFGVAAEKAVADAADALAKVPAGAATSVPQGTNSAATTIAPKP
jgi:Tfp pilus assembly protein PilO